MNKITSLLVAFFSLFAIWQMGAQVGNTCANPIVIESLPFNDVDDTANYTSVYDGVPGSGCGTIDGYLSGREAIYAFTPEVSGEINVVLSPEDIYAGIFVYDSCSNIGVACYANAYGYNANSTADIEFIMPVERDQTYYFVISVWADGDDDSTPYELNITEVSCSRPALVTVESLGVGEASISWDGSADSFEYAYNTSGANPASGTLTTETEVELTGLDEGETYFFFVRSVCEDNETSAWTDAISFRVPGLGDTCEVAIPIASLPYTITDNTANYANEYSGTPGAACGGATDYLNGNNVVYTYTADFNGAVNVELISAASNKGVFVYDSCDNIGVVCYDGAFADAAGADVNFTLYVTEGETYYLVLTTKFDGQPMDYELNLSAVTCPTPGGIALNNATPTTADFSWVGIDEATAYEYALTTTNTAPTTGIQQTTDISVALTDLTADTNYYFWLRAICGTETTDWADSFHFFTGYCTPTYTSTGDYLRTISFNAIASELTYTRSSAPAGNYDNQSQRTLVVYPGAQVDLHTEYQGGMNKVMIWIDTNNNMQFEEAELFYVGQQQTGVLNNGQFGSFTIPNNAQNGTYRMRVRGVYGSNPVFDACNSQTYGSAVDFTVEIVDAPTCPHVENIVLAAATPNSATISWDANPTVESYILKYGEPGFNPETEGTAVEVTGTSHTVEGLFADTNYEFYVRAVCADNDMSFWGRSLDVFTGYCTPSYNSNGEYLTYVTTEGAFIDLDYSRTSAPTGNYDNQAAQQVVVAPGMSFTMNTRYSSGANTIVAWADWNGNMSFEANEEVANTYSSNNEQSFTIEVPASVDYGEYRLRVASRWSNNPIQPCGTGYSWGTTVDFTIVVAEEPDCMPVEELTAETTSLTSIQVDWEGPENAIAWEVEYMPTGAPVGTGTTVETDTNSLLLEDLESNITYDIYVRPICEDSEEDALARMLSIYLGYCYPAYSATTNDHITAIATDGALNDISYSVNSRPANGYDNRHAEVLTAFAGSAIDFTTSYQGGAQGIKVWADLNNNASFDDDEVLYFGHSSIAAHNGVLDIPADLEPGEYRLRFVSVYGSTIAIDDACGSYTHGSTVDFTLEIVELDCMPATEIEFTQDDDNNIIMSWTGNDDVEEWFIEYGETGFTPGQGTEVTTTDDFYVFTDLELDSTYDFYITGDCEDEDGITIGPKKFFYGYCVPTYTSTSDYLRTFNTNGALLDMSYSVSSRPANGYDNRSDIIITAFAGSLIDFTADYQGGGHGIKIWADFDRNLLFDNDEVLYYDHHTTSNGHEGEFSIPTVAAGEYRMRIMAVYGSTVNISDACGTNTYGSAVDVTLQIIDLDCMPAADIEFTQDDNSNILMTWTGNDDVEEWLIEYGTSGFTLGQGTTVTTSENFYLFTDLSLNNEYDFYITGDCEDEEGITVGPRKFFYGYCTPSSNSEYTSRIQTYNAFEDIHYERNSFPAGGYDNVANEYELVVIPGEEFEFEVSYNLSSFTTRIWVDWNRSLSFEEDEMIFNQHSSTNTVASSMTLPLDTEPGTYQMRVRTRWSTTDFGPCDHQSWGSAVDLTLIVIDAPTCLAPIDLEVLNTYVDGVELTWEDRQDVDDIAYWEIEYGLAGYTHGTGTVVQANENPFRVEGLESSSSYDFYIRAVCNEDDPSLWSRHPVTASTLCGPVGIPYVLDFETAVQPDIPYCTSQAVGAGSNSWFTEVDPGYFWGNTTVLRYQRHDTNAADAWFFTQGVILEAGEWYAITYDYMVGNSQFAESMKVVMGVEPDAASMTTVLEDHPEIAVDGVTQNVVEFQVPADGVYYFGFHAYSDAAQFALFLDNIIVDVSLGVDNLKEITFGMYPNPADVEVHLEADTNIETIAIHNMLGQTVKQFDVNANEKTINIQDLQSGAYIIEVMAEGKRQSKQLIKK